MWWISVLSKFVNYLLNIWYNICQNYSALLNLFIIANTLNVISIIQYTDAKMCTINRNHKQDYSRHHTPWCHLTFHYLMYSTVSHVLLYSIVLEAAIPTVELYSIIADLLAWQPFKLINNTQFGNHSLWHSVLWHQNFRFISVQPLLIGF